MTETLTLPGAKAVIYPDGPMWDGTPTATIGNFCCDDAQSGAALLRQATTDLRARGITRVLGPMEGDTWHSYRLICESDGSAPFLMEPSSAPHDLAAFETAGFRSIASYFSARAAAVPGAAPDLAPELSIETWDGQDPAAHFSEVHALSTRAFANNLFYKPLSQEDFLVMYMPFAPLLRRELIFLARDAQGSLVGYLFGIPNYAEGPASKTVILKTYASLQPGLGHALVHAFHQAARDMGFETAIHALIQDDNRSADRSAKHGGTIFRRYALMGWIADGTDDG
ncbi:MAG: hypothetical protein AAGA70_17410 [Pseudomonadota bacterium]